MRKLLAGVALAAALAVPQITRAQDVAEGPNSGKLTFSGGVDVVSSYIFRGYEIEDSGYIVQPFAQVNAAVYESDSLSITPYIGTWHSLQDRAEPGDGSWFEADFYGGVDFGMGDFTLGAIYTLYTYPDDAYENVDEVGLKLSYDDSKFAEDVGLPFALNPYVAWYKELSDQNPGGTQDQYLEVGITPAFDLADTPFSFAFPIAAGFSVDDYYFDEDGDDEFFGFVSAGAYAYYALPFGTDYGSWTLYAGGTYYYYNAESLRVAAGEDRNHEIMGKVGVTFTY